MIISKVVSRYDKFSILQIDLQMLTTEPSKPINFTMHQLFILFLWKCAKYSNFQVISKKTIKYGIEFACLTFF